MNGKDTMGIEEGEGKGKRGKARQVTGRWFVRGPASPTMGAVRRERLLLARRRRRRRALVGGELRVESRERGVESGEWRVECSVLGFYFWVEVRFEAECEADSRGEKMRLFR